MSNTHSAPDVMVEMMARDADHLCSLVLASLGAAVPAPPALTFPGIAVVAYVREGINLRYVSQDTHAVTLTGADGHYWLAVHADTFTAVSGWTRQPGTHFLWRPSATHPGNPLAGLTFVDVTVAGGVITGSALIPQVLGPPMSQFPASAVAITGGTATLDNVHVRGNFSVDIPTLVVDATANSVGMGVPPTSGWALRASNAEIVGGLQVDEPTLHVDPATNSVGFGVAPAAPFALRASNAEIVGGFQVDEPTLHVDPMLNAVGFGRTPVADRSLTAVNASISALVTGPSSNLPSVTSQMVWYAKATTHGITLAPVDNDTGPGAALLFWNSGGVTVGTIVTSATGTLYNTTSDVRLKHSIHPLAGAVDAVRALKPIAFAWNSTGERDEGFLAHELMRVIPHAVSGEPEAVNADGTVKPQGVDHSKLVPWLVSALQATMAQVETLTARVASLEEQLGV